MSIFNHIGHIINSSVNTVYFWGKILTSNKNGVLCGRLPGFLRKFIGHILIEFVVLGKFDGSCPRFGPAASVGFQV